MILVLEIAAGIVLAVVVLWIIGNFVAVALDPLAREGLATIAGWILLVIIGATVFGYVLYVLRPVW